MQTRIAELPGIRYSILQGGMQWEGKTEPAAAVSDAGGLGILTVLTQPGPAELARKIRRTREMTDQPSA